MIASTDARDRLDHLSMVCANPSDGLSAGLWCQAANEGLMLARSLFEQLEALRRVEEKARLVADVFGSTASAIGLHEAVTELREALASSPAKRREHRPDCGRRDSHEAPRECAAD